MGGVRFVVALFVMFGYGKGPLPPPGESEDKSGDRRCPTCGGVLRRRGDKSFCRKCAGVFSKKSGSN